MMVALGDIFASFVLAGLFVFLVVIWAFFAAAVGTQNKEDDDGS